MMFALAGPDDEEVQLRDRDATRAGWLYLRYCKHYRGMLGICVVCVYNMRVCVSDALPLILYYIISYYIILYYIILYYNILYCIFYIT
jgi:hypothetical protein